MLSPVTIETLAAGAADVESASAALASRLPEPLRPLADLAYNYRWSWTTGGPELFASIDAARWGLTHSNPVRLLQEVPPQALERLARDDDFIARMHDVHAARRGRPRPPVRRERGHRAPAGRVLLRRVRRPPVAARLLRRPRRPRRRHPEGGVRPRRPARRRRPHVPPRLLPPAHRRRRLAARVLGRHRRRPRPGRARDRGRPAAHRQRAGRRPAGRRPGLAGRGRPRAAAAPRHEPAREHPGRPLHHVAPVRRRAGSPPRPVRGARHRRRARAAGDARRPGGRPPQRGPRRLRLPRARARRGAAQRLEPHDAFAAARARTVFTTHTPVPAGNDTYPADQVADLLSGEAAELGVDVWELIARGRTNPADPNEPFGVTQFALRSARAANGVAARHGEVARDMWHGLWPDRAVEDVPITHVTNGVHIPTWLGGPMRELLDRHLGEDWPDARRRPATWDARRRHLRRRPLGRPHRAAPRPHRDGARALGHRAPRPRRGQGVRRTRPPSASTRTR